MINGYFDAETFDSTDNRLSTVDYQCRRNPCQFCGFTQYAESLATDIVITTINPHAKYDYTSRGDQAGDARAGHGRADRSALRPGLGRNQRHEKRQSYFQHQIRAMSLGGSNLHRPRT